MTLKMSDKNNEMKFCIFASNFIANIVKSSVLKFFRYFIYIFVDKNKNGCYCIRSKMNESKQKWFVITDAWKFKKNKMLSIKLIASKCAGNLRIWYLNVSSFVTSLTNSFIYKTLKTDIYQISWTLLSSICI